MILLVINRFDGKSEPDGYDGGDIFGAMVAGAVLTVMLLGAVAASCLALTAKRKRERGNRDRVVNPNGIAANSSVIVKDCKLQARLHRDSERQLHFETKFEHEEMVLVA